MATASDLQQLYVGYFGRAADQEGLNFWLEAINNGGLSLDNVHASFVQSEEYVAMYEGLSNSDLVTQVYLNVLGRGVEAEGLAFWAGALDAGTITQDQLIEGLLSGLSANDALIVQNKVTVANYYTNQVGASYGEADKAGSAAILADVDGTLDSISVALDLIADVVPGGVPDALATALAQLEAAQNAREAYATALLGDDAADPADPAADVAEVEAAYGPTATPLTSKLAADITAFNAVSTVDIAASDSATVTAQKITEATTAAQTAVTTAQNTLNTTVGPALVNSYNAALARFNTAVEASSTADLNQVGELAQFNALVSSDFTVDLSTGETANVAGDELIVLDGTNLVLESTFATGATPAQLAAANELLAVVQARVAADKAEANAATALQAQAALVDAKDGTMTSADIDANGVITGGLLDALADAKEVQTALAEAVADLAETNTIIADWAELVEGVENAGEAIVDLGYTMTSVTAGDGVAVNGSNDVFVFDESDADIALDGDDVLFVGTGYSLGVDDAATAGLQGGNNALLEVFFVLNGGTVEAHIETVEFGSSATAQETNVITLTGVAALDQVAFDANTGFITLA